MAREVSAPRVLALWCPDWPAIAAGAEKDLSPEQPIAVLSGGRVLSCSAAARAAGVRRGMRKREVQAICPHLYVTVDDAGRSARMFEPVLAAVADVIPAVEVMRPGLMVMSISGATRHFGSEADIAERVIDVVSACGVESQTGIADEVFTAVLAARHARLVDPGGGREFLAPLAVSELGCEPVLCAGPNGVADRDELIDLLWRMGIRTIGAFAALEVTDVSTRFGTDAVVAHRSARALPTRPVSARGPDADLVVEYRCDPLLEFVEAAAFVGRRLADDLHQRLLAANVACTRLTVRAVTASATSYARTWRCVRPMTPEDTADRIRWQLEGWMSGRNAPRPDAPIAVLRLEPVEVIDAAEMQYGFSGAGLPSDNETQERVRRALVRVQGLLGGDAVRVPVRSGGRGPAEQVTMVALGDEPAAARDPSLPWPGRLGGPSPAVLSSEPVEVLDAAGSPVRVTTRGGFSADPVSLCWGRRSWSVRWWTGPWSADEKWWMPGNDGVTSRAQVLLDDSRALLLRHERSAWVVEGVYE
ncbi:DNA polymerase Y family protein [Gordonia jinhuaensis]|uniref:DNA polymerase n=1 Tax=Gordonia jinhuaensis TaxID=1517702 RepID=A0A916SU82_9ACTN|nr:DNA polymerase Y family protein [Gordonia jinhuaensis]GGB17280.1 DNA polymerase [Gordonia jinhuaensis]